MSAYERELLGALRQRGWEQVEILGSDRWSMTQQWRIRSVRENWGFELRLSFLVDPQYEGPPEKRASAVWAVAASPRRLEYGSDRNAAAMLVIRPQFEQRLAAFMDDLDDLRRAGGPRTGLSVRIGPVSLWYWAYLPLTVRTPEAEVETMMSSSPFDTPRELAVALLCTCEGTGTYVARIHADPEILELVFRRDQNEVVFEARRGEQILARATGSIREIVRPFWAELRNLVLDAADRESRPRFDWYWPLELPTELILEIDAALRGIH